MDFSHLTAYSTARSERSAVQEISAKLRATDPELTLLFCSPDYDRKALEAALSNESPTATIGSVTAGEITCSGYRDGSLSAIALPKAYFTAVSRLVPCVRNFSIQDGARLIREMKRELDDKTRHRAGSSFALLFVDGLSCAEEKLAVAFSSALATIPLVGGSAGGTWSLTASPILFEQAFPEDSAVIALVHTTLPVTVFSTHHFEASPTKVVITSADPSKRLVTEINGAPAAHEYARLCNIPREQLTRDVLCDHPFVVRIGGKYYARGILDVDENDHMHFACAIDEGVVFSISHPRHPIRTLRSELESVHREIGPIGLTIGIECAFRKLENERRQLTHEMAGLCRDYNIVGFSSFGEQYNSIHMNHSFSGIALGLPDAEA